MHGPTNIKKLYVYLQLLPEVVHDVEGHMNMYQNSGEDFRQQVTPANPQFMGVFLTSYRLRFGRPT